MQKYPLALRILHWLIGFSILMLIAVGWRMSGLPRTDPMHDLLFMMHKSFGVTVLALVSARVFIRLTQPVPELPEGISKRDHKMAGFAYVIFYLLMFSIPVIGILMSNSFGFAVSYFGWFDLPKLITTPNKELGKDLAELHEIFAYTLLALMGVHVAAVVKHHVIDKVNLLRRMF